MNENSVVDVLGYKGNTVFVDVGGVIIDFDGVDIEAFNAHLRKLHKEPIKEIYDYPADERKDL